MTMKIMINGEVRNATAKEVSDIEASRVSLSTLAAADYQRAVQQVIDQTAADKQFNDGVTLASYVASTVEPWARQAQAFVAWRDDVWQYAYSELSKVKGGVRPSPTVADFLMELPEIVWPK